MRKNIIKNFLYKFFVSFNILDFLLRIKAIYLISFFSKKFTLNINKTSFKKNYRVLSLGRTIFDEDIKAIAESNLKSNFPIQYLRIDKYFFTKTFIPSTSSSLKSFSSSIIFFETAFDVI